MTCFCCRQEQNVIDDLPPARRRTYDEIQNCTENNITAFGSSEHIEEAEAKRKSLPAAATGRLGGKVAATRLVEIWNSLPGIEPVERFTKPAGGRQPGSGKPSSGLSPARRTERPRRPETEFRQEAAASGAKAYRREQQDRSGDRAARTAKGATLKELMRATGWQTHSVRGLISGQLRRN